MKTPKNPISETTPQPFVEAFARLVRLIQPTRLIEPGTVDDYYAILRGFRMEILLAAGTILAQQPRKFFPPSGDWFELAKEIDFERRFSAGNGPVAQVPATITPATLTSVGEPNIAGEFPYDPAETFTDEEMEAAIWWRSHAHGTAMRPDACPHTPACPSVRVCLEEIAWYLRHRRELHDRDERIVEARTR